MSMLRVSRGSLCLGLVVFAGGWCARLSHGPEDFQLVFGCLSARECFVTLNLHAAILLPRLRKLMLGQRPQLFDELELPAHNGMTETELTLELLKHLAL